MSTLKVTTINDEFGGSAAVLYGVASPPNSMGFRNRIINGSMVIDQRNAGASVTVNSTTAAYPVDRWFGRGAATAGVFTLQQVSDAPAGFKNSMKTTVTTTAASPGATDFYGVQHRIEGYNIADLGYGTASSQAVTVSFWVKSSVTGTFSVALSNNNDQTIPVTFVVNAANTWEQKTVTVAGTSTGTWDSTNGTGLLVLFTLGAGSSRTGTAGAWSSSFFINATGSTNLMATSGATFYITGVQLEAGSVASPFERRDYGRELMMCQRYYEKSFPQGIAPANGGSSTTLATADGSVSGMAQNRIGAGPTTQFKVPKRAIPTMTKYGNSSGDWIYALQNSSALVGNANSGLGRVSESAFTADQQIVDGTAIFVIGHWTASAEL